MWKLLLMIFQQKKSTLERDLLFSFSCPNAVDANLVYQKSIGINDEPQMILPLERFKASFFENKTEK